MISLWQQYLGRGQSISMSPVCSHMNDTEQQSVFILFSIPKCILKVKKIIHFAISSQIAMFSLGRWCVTAKNVTILHYISVFR